MPDVASHANLASVVLKIPSLTIDWVIWLFASVIFKGIFEVPMRTVFASLSQGIEVGAVDWQRSAIVHDSRKIISLSTVDSFASPIWEVIGSGSAGCANTCWINSSAAIYNALTVIKMSSVCTKRNIVWNAESIHDNTRRCKTGDTGPSMKVKLITVRIDWVACTEVYVLSRSTLNVKSADPVFQSISIETSSAVKCWRIKGCTRQSVVLVAWTR